MFEIAPSLDLGEIASDTRGRNRFAVSLPLIFAIGCYALVISYGSVILSDPDTYWHIVVGRWIIEHGSSPTHGIFSATMSNAPWIDGEWLAEILIAWIYDHFGWVALIVGTALCEAVSIAILLRALLGVLPPVYAMFATTLAYALWLPHILARPYILTTPLLVMWVAALVRARSENRAPSPWLALLIVFWANLHGSFMFGIVLAALFAGEAVLLASDWHGRFRATRDWGCFGLLVVGAAMVTPNGFEALLAPYRIASMSILPYIGEFHGVDFSNSGAIPLALWLVILLFAALTLGWRLPPTRVGMLLFLLVMALKHQRYGEYLGVATALFMAPTLALQFSRNGSDTAVVDRLMAELAKPANWRGFAIASVVFMFSTIALPKGNIHPVDPISPVNAIAEVKAQHIKGPVFNFYNFGGYLIFSGIQPFIDGRAELYGDVFIKHYIDAMAISDDHQLPELLNDYGITWTLLPSKTTAVVLMDHLPGWRRLYSDSVAVVHVRHMSGNLVESGG